MHVFPKAGHFPLQYPYHASGHNICNHPKGSLPWLVASCHFLPLFDWLHESPALHSYSVVAGWLLHSLCKYLHNWLAWGLSSEAAACAESYPGCHRQSCHVGVPSPLKQRHSDWHALLALSDSSQNSRYLPDEHVSIVDYIRLTHAMPFHKRQNCGHITLALETAGCYLVIDLQRILAHTRDKRCYSVLRGRFATTSYASQIWRQSSQFFLYLQWSRWRENTLSLMARYCFCSSWCRWGLFVWLLDAHHPIQALVRGLRPTPVTMCRSIIVITPTGLSAHAHYTTSTL